MIFTIARKELRAFFSSPLAWLVLAVAQAILGYFFLRLLDDFMQIQPQISLSADPDGLTARVAAPTYIIAAKLLLFTIPLLAMRLIAEERRNQTLTFLLSAPVTMTEIIIGKFLGLMSFLLIIILLVLAMPLMLTPNTHLDFGLLAGLTLGLLLLTANFAAVSLWASNLVAQPTAAALLGFGVLLAMLLMGETIGDTLQERGWYTLAALVQALSPLKNFEPLSRGVIDSYAIICSLLLVTMFLILAIRRLDGQRLRG